jgi:hypothetical protein
MKKSVSFLVALTAVAKVETVPVPPDGQTTNR